MRALVLIVLLLLGAVRLEALEARFQGTTLVIRDGKNRFWVPDQCDPFAFFRTVHSVQRRGGFYYVVFGTSAMSRGWPPKSGHCGAGIESSIKWLKIKEGSVVEEQEGRYESCFQNRDGGSIAWRDGKLIWSSCGTREREIFGQRDYELVDFTWVFDPSRPAEGIHESVERSAEYQGN